MTLASAPSRVAVVDDDPAMRDLLAAHLARTGHTVSTHARAASALAMADACDIVVSDLRMPDMDGIALCRAIQGRVPVILISAFGTMETAILALRAGAADFVPKPFRIDTLLEAIARAAPRPARPVDAGLVGSSAAIDAVRERIAKVAPRDAAVLVTGESGTGKELVARAIHAASPRAAGPLVVVNCAAIPPALVESELFGHVRGAFTDARGDRAGLFATAHGGTLFLDEIGELPLETQPKLLRALQERIVRPVGGSSELAVDVRVVAATNRDLDAMVARGTFREDLYYRVHVLHVALPPLRERGDDVLELARHFAHGTPIAADAAVALLAHSWPGNVRELESALVHACALAEAGPIHVAHLPDRVAQRRGPTSDSQLVTLAELERRHVAWVLERVDGNKSKAARILGIERKTLYRMLERWQ
ncbi:MAG TPA: sigma-54 dependent transcriptional regulator [Kofleriaceae bacterium]|jgi:two-component system response regulator HydG